MLQYNKHLNKLISNWQYFVSCKHHFLQSPLLFSSSSVLSLPVVVVVGFAEISISCFNRKYNTCTSSIATHKYLPREIPWLDQNFLVLFTNKCLQMLRTIVSWTILYARMTFHSSFFFSPSFTMKNILFIERWKHTTCPYDRQSIPNTSVFFILFDAFPEAPSSKSGWMGLRVRIEGDRKKNGRIVKTEDERNEGRGWRRAKA